MKKRSALLAYAAATAISAPIASHAEQYLSNQQLEINAESQVQSSTSEDSISKVGSSYYLEQSGEHRLGMIGQDDNVQNTGFFWGKKKKDGADENKQINVQNKAKHHQKDGSKSNKKEKNEYKAGISSTGKSYTVRKIDYHPQMRKKPLLNSLENFSFLLSGGLGYVPKHSISYSFDNPSKGFHTMLTGSSANSLTEYKKISKNDGLALISAPLAMDTSFNGFIAALYSPNKHFSFGLASTYDYVESNGDQNKMFQDTIDNADTEKLKMQYGANATGSIPAANANLAGFDKYPAGIKFKDRKVGTESMIAGMIGGRFLLPTNPVLSVYAEAYTGVGRYTFDPKDNNLEGSTLSGYDAHYGFSKDSTTDRYSIIISDERYQFKTDHITSMPSTIKLDEQTVTTSEDNVILRVPGENIKKAFADTGKMVNKHTPIGSFGVGVELKTKSKMSMGVGYRALMSLGEIKIKGNDKEDITARVPFHRHSAVLSLKF